MKSWNLTTSSWSSNISKRNNKFTDPDFPPKQSSVGNVEDLTVNAEWKRISDIIRNSEFVSGKFELGDILQGNIGDYYFLSAIAALAEFYFRIKNLFTQL